MYRDSEITMINKFRDLMDRMNDTHEHGGHFRRDENYFKSSTNMLSKKITDEESLG